MARGEEGRAGGGEGAGGERAEPGVDSRPREIKWKNNVAESRGNNAPIKSALRFHVL